MRPAIYKAPRLASFIDGTFTTSLCPVMKNCAMPFRGEKTYPTRQIEALAATFHVE